MQKTKHVVSLKGKIVVSLKRIFSTEFDKSHQTKYSLISNVM